jgi:hypothetical protein
LGEVYKPENMIQKRKRQVPDLTPTPLPQSSSPMSLETILREIESMKAEITKIKQSLRAHGISVE